MPTGKETPLLHYAANKAFWRLGLAFLRKLMKEEGLATPRGLTLYQAVKTLVKHWLPDLEDKALSGILAQRAFKAGGPSKDDLPEELVEGLFPEALDRREIEDRSL
eukprot:2069147-Lingulodinium_polyedra.AAC.1